MSKRHLIAGFVALGLGAAGAVQAQTTTPPERMNGASTANNPATAATPQPGSPAAMSTPGTMSTTTPPSLGTPGDTTRTTPPAATHSDAAPTGSAIINSAVNTSSDNKPGAPVSGANSFTEGQAKSRIEDRGFSEISDLKLDNSGVWRAKATKDGKTVTVALDYQGNVVAQ